MVMISFAWSADRGGAHGPISMDVTGLVQAWIDRAHENHGVRLEHNTTGRTMYRSREHLRTDDRPWLEVCYFAP